MMMKLFGRKNNEETEEGRESTTPYYAAAVDEEGNRHRHLCFNRYCDMRIGTFTMNILNIVIRTICLICEFAWGKWYPIPTDYGSIICSLIAIFGAYNFEYRVTGLAVLGHIWVVFVHLFWASAWYGIVFDAFMIYPTTVLTLELYRCILTEGNYPRERYVLPQIQEPVERFLLDAPGHIERIKVGIAGNTANTDTTNNNNNS